MNLNELYTQIITENSRSKQNRHLIFPQCDSGLGKQEPD